MAKKTESWTEPRAPVEYGGFKITKSRGDPTIKCIRCGAVIRDALGRGAAGYFCDTCLESKCPAKPVSRLEALIAEVENFHLTSWSPLPPVSYRWRLSETLRQ